MYPSLSRVETSTWVVLFGMLSFRLISEMFQPRFDEFKNSRIENARSTDAAVGRTESDIIHLSPFRASLDPYVRSSQLYANQKGAPSFCCRITGVKAKPDRRPVLWTKSAPFWVGTDPCALDGTAPSGGAKGIVACRMAAKSDRRSGVSSV